VRPGRVHGCVHDISHARTAHSLQQLLTRHPLLGTAADCQLKEPLVLRLVETLIPELPHFWVVQLVITVNTTTRE
jgi:hypothetical protein